MPYGAPFHLLYQLHLGAGAHKELHFHLFELPHAEDKLTGHDLVSERLADLGYAERNLLAVRLLNIGKVDRKYPERFRGAG
jgi:hypothetical protein